MKKEADSFIKNNNIVIYYGLRGIGKTVLLYKISNYLKEKAKFIDGTILKYENLDLLNVINEYIKLKNIKFILIDDVNSIPKWAALKIIFDLYNIKIIATGSNAIEISKQKINYTNILNMFDIICTKL